jgi:hypothetical protein
MRKIFVQFYEFVSVKTPYLSQIAISIALFVMCVTVVVSEYYYERMPGFYVPVIFLTTYFSMISSAFLLSHLKFYFVKRHVKKRPGQIVDVFVSRSSCYLTWEYEYQGRKYRGGTSTFRGRSKWFKNGQSVLITIDSRNPQSSFLEELYE